MNSFLINPYEALGKAHTEGLNYIIDSIVVLPHIPRIDDIIRLSAEFACRQLRPDNSFSQGELYSMMSIVSYAINTLNDIKSVYQDSNLNQQQIIFLERMLSVNPYIKIENQRESFRLIEGEIFAYPMPYREKEILLIGSAIGKHSSAYWQEQFENPLTSPWAPYLPADDDPWGPLAKKTWPREDAKGAVSGAIGGGIGGIPAGPGGIVTGAVLGGIGGAVGASAASALLD